MAYNYIAFVVFHKAALFYYVSTSYADTPTRVTVQFSWTSQPKGGNGTSTLTHSCFPKVKGNSTLACLSSFLTLITFYFCNISSPAVCMHAILIW